MLTVAQQDRRELAAGAAAIAITLAVVALFVYELSTSARGRTSTWQLSVGGTFLAGLATAVVALFADRLFPDVSARLRHTDATIGIALAVGLSPLLRELLPPAMGPFAAAFGAGFLVVLVGAMVLALLARVVEPQRSEGGLSEADVAGIQRAQRSRGGSTLRLRAR